MEAFLANIFGFPTVLFTVLLAVIALYWLLAILGLLELDILDFGAELEGDDALAGLAGLMVTLGLAGVPATVVVTLLLLVAWLITYFGEYFLLFLGVGGWLHTLAGVGIVLAALALAIPCTAQLIRPLKPLFKKAYAGAHHKSLLGTTCLVRSGRVSERSGEATASVHGASLILKVRCDSDTRLRRGDKAVLIEYRPADNTYLVVAEKQFNPRP